MIEVVIHLPDNFGKKSPRVKEAITNLLSAKHDLPRYIKPIVQSIGPTGEILLCRAEQK